MSWRAYSETLGSFGARETRLSDRPSLTLPEKRRRPTCQSVDDKRADVQIDNSKGVGGREAHRLSWDSWLTASAGLPLSITHTGGEKREERRV